MKVTTLNALTLIAMTITSGAISYTTGYIIGVTAPDFAPITPLVGAFIGLFAAKIALRINHRRNMALVKQQMAKLETLFNA